MTVTLTSLWLPILLSAVAVWFWSFLAWAILPVHRKDYGKLPNEEAFLTAVRGMNVPQGSYVFPYCTHKERSDPAMQEKWKTGPVGRIGIWNPNMSMGVNMGLTFLIYLI